MKEKPWSRGTIRQLARNLIHVEIEGWSRKSKDNNVPMSYGSAEDSNSLPYGLNTPDFDQVMIGLFLSKRWLWLSVLSMSF